MKEVPMLLHSMLITVGCAALAAIAGSASAQSQAEQALWLERLDPADRAPLRRIIDHAPAAFPDELHWHGVAAKLSWQELRDKVVVIQSWTSANEQGREAVDRAREAVESFSDIDVQLILLHTPEGADEAAKYIRSEGIDATVVVDPVGAFCDSLGVYRRPVNLVIDRHGAVRFAGLTPTGVTAAVNALIDEIYDPDRCPDQRSAVGGPGEFPTFTTPLGRTRDNRGRPAPALHVQDWISDAPETDDKLVVLAFWATWCAPCIAAIPRLNELAEKFPGEVAVIGVSSEGKAQIESGMSRRNLRVESFKYAIGYDGQGTMSNAVGVQGIPHAIVMCKDWIVRWQGHPAGLNDDVLRQLIDANSAGDGKPVGRWMASR